MAVTWRDVTGRMVRYCKAHNFDALDQPACIRVQSVFKHYLLRHRADPDTAQLHDFDTSDPDAEEWIEK